MSDECIFENANPEVFLETHAYPTGVFSEEDLDKVAEQIRHYLVRADGAERLMFHAAEKQDYLSALKYENELGENCSALEAVEGLLENLGYEVKHDDAANVTINYKGR